MKLMEAVKCLHIAGSHPARGAWIETFSTSCPHWALDVAPREGCVD